MEETGRDDGGVEMKFGEQRDDPECMLSIGKGCFVYDFVAALEERTSITI
jgi:hypothetical protein